MPTWPYTNHLAVSRTNHTVRSGWHITVDPVACDAYGYCAELLPEAIALDEWGYPMVDNRALPSELIATAKRAVRDCPKRALSLSQQKIIR
jgi:ferredoxin